MVTILFPGTTRHVVLYIGTSTLSTACNSDKDRQKLILCDFEGALGGDAWCVKTLFEGWNPLLPHLVLYIARVLCY